MENILDNQERLALSKWFIQEKKLDQALIYIKPVIADKKADPESKLVAARLYAQLHLYTHAEALFEAYLSEKTDDTTANFQLGMCYFDQGKNDKALNTWTTILKQNENHPPALFYSAIAMLQNKNDDGAIAQLKKIISTVQTDNLYYGKAKELLIEVEKQSSNIAQVASREIYQTEH